MMIQIGSPNWIEDLKETTSPLGSDFWSNFVQASEAQLNELEKQAGRKLPDEFRELYRSIGYGSFSLGGGFYSPDDIIVGLGAPIYFVLGSLFSGKEWATEEEHRQLWLTRGAVNPNPGKFTDTALTLEEVKLYDLMQFGSDGCCCYHQLYMGPEPAPFQYCLLTDYGKIEDKSPSVSLALEKIVRFYLSNLESE
jgi:hypothetical protein